MKLRSYKPEDAPIIDEIYNRCHGHFALPDLKHCIISAVVEDDNEKIIAFGSFELIPELTLILDTDKPKKDQVRALKDLLIAGDFTASLHGYDMVYAFPDSNSYAEILKKHFGFEDGKPILSKKVGV